MNDISDSNCPNIDSLTDVLDCLANCYLLDTGGHQGDPNVISQISILFGKIEYYIKTHRHIEYSLVHIYVFSNSRTPDTFDEIQQYCDILLESAKATRDTVLPENSVAFEATCDFLVKIKDHVQLETFRLNSYKSILLDVEQLHDSVYKTKFEADNKLREMELLSQKIEKSEKSTVNMTVTVLGIFSAAILGISTGIQVLSGFFSVSNDWSPYRLVVLCALSGLVVYNILFLLLYGIAKITDNGIATSYAPFGKYFLKRIVNDPKTWLRINGKDCLFEEPDADKYTWKETSIFTRLIIRYPYVFWPNLSMFLLIILSCILWVARYNWGWNWLPPR